MTGSVTRLFIRVCVSPTPAYPEATRGTIAEAGNLRGRLLLPGLRADHVDADELAALRFRRVPHRHDHEVSLFQLLGEGLDGFLFVLLSVEEQFDLLVRLLDHPEVDADFPLACLLCSRGDANRLPLDEEKPFRPLGFDAG